MQTHSSDEPLQLGALLSDREYVHSRFAPSLRDGYYLSNTDVATVVAMFAQQAGGKLFDYGCGGSPYRALFKQCSEYIRADVTPSPGIDRLLGADTLTHELPDCYDVVLSTQVLEHVANPAAYVSECHRILKSGGQLLITTHGLYEEHGCPNDYFRWTPDGLEKLVTSAGLKVLESYKLTAELRGIIQLTFCFAQHLRYPGHPLVHYPLVLSRKIYNRVLCPLLNLVGKALDRQGVLPGNSPASLYVGVAVRARKP